MIYSFYSYNMELYVKSEKKSQRVSKLKEQGERYTLCSREHFCFHDKWW